MRLVALLGLVVLGACVPLQSGDPASPYYAWSTGWSVRLERPLTIAAGEATVRLQYGRIVPRNSVQEHDPFCIVELETVGESAQTLHPGRFEVRRVTRSVDPVSAAVATPWVRTRGRVRTQVAKPRTRGRVRTQTARFWTLAAARARRWIICASMAKYRELIWR